MDTQLELKFAKDDLKLQNKILKENKNLKEEVEKFSRQDIKSSLVPILKGPPMVFKNPHLTKSEKEILQLMLSSGQKILELVTNSIDLFKLEKGKYQINPVDLDFKKIVETAILQYKPEANGTGVELIFHPLEVQDKEFGLKVFGEDMLYYRMVSHLIDFGISLGQEGDISIYLKEFERQVTCTIELPCQIADKEGLFF